MILTHFSKEPFVIDPSYNYMHRYGKPCGLWLSDETESGWKWWCEGEGFRLEKLKVQTHFEVDISNVLVIRSEAELIRFNSEYRVPSLHFLDVIDWVKVTDKYKGIVISPHQFELRLEPDFEWYSCWDCASGCFWDFSCLKEVVCV